MEKQILIGTQNKGTIDDYTKLIDHNVDQNSTSEALDNYSSWNDTIPTLHDAEKEDARFLGAHLFNKFRE